MDSSPDLSLKLRRGSSDSRDSFYMDFAQGIDSDIEDVVTQASGGASHPQTVTTPSTLAPITASSTTASLPDVTVLSACGTSHSGTAIIPEDPEDLDDDMEEMGPVPPPMPELGDHPIPSIAAGMDLPLPPLPTLEIDDRDIDLPLQQLMPSPSVPQNAIVSPESFSNHTSPGQSSQHLAMAETPTPQQQQLEAQSHPPLLPQQDYPLHGDESRVGSSLDTQSKTQLGSSSTSSAFQRIHTPTLSVKTNPVVIFPGSSSPSLPTPIPLQPSPTTIHRQPPPGSTTTTQHLAVLYHSHHHHLHPILNTTRRPSRLPEPIYYHHQQQREVKPGEALATTLSALYGKLLVVMGIAFPMAEVISTYIPPSFYEGFYLYLYIGSMVFLLFMYTTLLWGRPKTPTVSPVNKSPNKKIIHRTSTTCSTDSGERSDSDDDTVSSGPKVMIPSRRMSLSAATSRIQHFGSFYLRMGAVAFGIGSMIYSGLEFGQYFELERDTKCHNVLLALTPATRMAFIFIQMYFIFLNNEQIKVYRHKILARFGLMHMIGTNLSVWFSVLIQETKHEILTFYNPENRTLRISHRLGHKTIPHPVDTVAHLRVARGLKGPHNIFECRRSNIIGTLVQDASPFLFPCTIEYSLICAAILYVMWRSISRPQSEPPQRQESLHPLKRSPHHYSVDCAGAHKGLFIGILILVLTIISLILFFVLISRPEFVNLAVTEVNICELTLYGTTTAATLIGMIQIRHMQYDAFRSFSLDDILLVGGQTGSFLYSTFTIIGGQFMMRRDTVLVLITALASLVETACQTMFILNASRRSAATQEHMRKKPGREIVTFLLVSNLAMWAINTLEKSRAESHPIQLHFYGLWAWTIITHVSMPLAIFYRFHSTVCLCEIWKRAYKMKPAYM
ncbi:proton channel OtopLc [Ochlerotatus camptorhynchus]|uniref:proton channel OtopLc n=1 Tax=Ochlerotatus camptorhynchus TaxID=644619 RepID=UPI0031CF83BD